MSSEKDFNALSAEVGAAVNNLLEVSENQLIGLTPVDPNAMGEAMCAVGEAIQAVTPDFDIAAYLTGGMEAAFKALLGTLPR